MAPPMRRLAPIAVTDYHVSWRTELLLDTINELLFTTLSVDGGVETELAEERIFVEGGKVMIDR